MEKKCLHCGKSLTKIGNARKNYLGCYDDWENRKYHKKCYRNYVQYQPKTN